MKSKILKKLLYPMVQVLIVPFVISVVTQLIQKAETKSNKAEATSVHRGLSVLLTYIVRALK